MAILHIKGAQEPGEGCSQDCCPNLESSQAIPQQPGRPRLSSRQQIAIGRSRSSLSEIDCALPLQSTCRSRDPVSCPGYAEQAGKHAHWHERTSAGRLVKACTGKGRAGRRRMLAAGRRSTQHITFRSRLPPLKETIRAGGKS